MLTQEALSIILPLIMPANARSYLLQQLLQRTPALYGGNLKIVDLSVKPIARSTIF